MDICYKTLFEVRVLHEYYLTASNGKNIFDRALADERTDFLRDLFISDARNINQDLEFVVPEAVLQNNKSVLLPTYAGFKVCIEVLPKKTSGVTTYWPKEGLTDDTTFPVLLLKRNSNVETYSNGRLITPTRSAFYFSNEEYAGRKDFPFLSNRVPDLNTNANYEQGELARYDLNDVRAFYRDGDDLEQWLKVSGDSGVNESDRVLVPPRFSYAVRPEDDITQLAFTLRAPDNAVVAQSYFAHVAGGGVTLSFREQDIRTVLQTAPAENATYTLEVTGDGAFARTHRLVFFSGPEFSRAWGLVHIKVKSANADFSLLNNDGSLRTQRQADGTFDPSHPVFEIPIRSRRTYWRYIYDNRQPIQTNQHGDYLDLRDGKLVSKTPRAMSYAPVFFLKPDNTLYYLPNPKPNETFRLENGKLFSDIYVGRSVDLFPPPP